MLWYWLHMPSSKIKHRNLFPRFLSSYSSNCRYNIVQNNAMCILTYVHLQNLLTGTIIFLGILCPDGNRVMICDSTCAKSTCATMPEAVCIPDPCTCQPKFYHPERFIAVNCDESKTWLQNVYFEPVGTNKLVNY